MGEDRTPSGLQRVEPAKDRVYSNDGMQYADSGASSVRTRRDSSTHHRTSDTDATPRRNESRWGSILSGVLTALTTFLLLELLVWGMRLPAGSDRMDTSYGIGAADWVTGFLGVLAFLIGGYVAGMSSGTRDRRPGRPGLRAGLMTWVLGTLLILALSAIGPDIIGAIWGAPADVLGADISVDNTGPSRRRSGTTRWELSLACCLGGSPPRSGAGSETSPKNECDRVPAMAIGAGG